MTDTVSSASLQEWIRAFARLVAENRDHLTDLDAAIGDGDHGANMDRGMRAAVAALDEAKPETAAALFTKVGMTVVSTVGGASGPLFGTLFLRMGASLGDAVQVTLPEFATALRAGLDGIVARGKAEAGDKTMYDALDPAVTALDRGVSDGLAKADALKLALVAAESGRDATTPMLARKGRASYLGERSVGHQDPGATSIALLMAAVGIYAVLAQATSHRTQEIGVRIALGASLRNIMLLVMRRGLWQIGAGLTLGLAAALPAARLMASLPIGVSPTDPAVFLAVAALLGIVGLAACWLPARSAASLDPVKAIRCE